MAILGAAAWTIEAIRHVERVESERDRWQRPTEVLRALRLKEGDVVVDLGSGVGYFALKLSGQVGRGGRVLAVDVRRFPLLFLRFRAFLGGQHNLRTIRGRVDDPRLPPGQVDAVLVANTYHELTDPVPILDRVYAALGPGGRLVVVDPGADGTHPEDRPGGAHRHETVASAEVRLRQAGFEIETWKDRFIERPDHGHWWLIVARKPSGPRPGPELLGASGLTR